MVAVTAAERTPGADAAPPRRRGRRPGGADTRGALLVAARAVFAERGFEGATVRLIAERAGVDPAMVNHWFGGKEALFTASLDLPVDPAVLIAEVVPGDPEELGERIVGRFLSIWDHTGGGRPLAALIRSVASHETAASMMRQFVTQRRGAPRRRHGGPEPRRSARLAVREPAHRARHGPVRPAARAARVSGPPNGRSPRWRRRCSATSRVSLTERVRDLECADPATVLEVLAEQRGGARQEGGLDDHGVPE